MNRRLGNAALLVAAVGVVAAVPGTGRAEPVGRAVAARGAVTAEDAGGGVRVLGKDSPVSEGEVITTGRKSFVILDLEDGTRMTLRPETVFEVEDYAVEPERESAVMRLFKGGLRAVSGFISKRRPDAFRVRTTVATIGIRGTEFDARLCGDDCRAEAEKARAAREGRAGRTSKVVGRVGFLKGALEAEDARGTTRPLTTGSPLYVEDELRTGSRSFAVLAFRDESRVTLQANTAFEIEGYAFDPEAPERGRSVMRLLRGGLRAITGLIGRNNPDAHEVNTPVATIGIRGTGFDLICQGDCRGTPQTSMIPSWLDGGVADLIALLLPRAHAAVPGPSGLFAAVWQGTIVFELPSGALVVDQGQVAFYDGQELIYLPELPVQVPEPRPDEVEIDEQALFATQAREGAPPGLYLSCYEGDCSMETDERMVNLGAGEAAYSDPAGEQVVRLEMIPPFQSEDPWLDVETLQFYNELLGDIGEGRYECLIQ